MHPNAQLIERLYTAIQRADAAAIADCYAPDGYFEDIAFKLSGRERIYDMWRMVCHVQPQVSFETGDIVAEDRTGRGRWRAKYPFGKTETKPGRPVDNTLDSTFVFRDGRIVEHRDDCDVGRWADQANAFPANLIARIEPIRRFTAARKLEKFLAEHPRPAG